MNPYYQNDKVTLYHGDSLEVLQQLETNSIDCVISDIPYSINYKGTGYRKLDLPENEIANDNKEFNFSEFLPEILRVLNFSRHLYIFSPDTSWTNHQYLSGVTELIWNKELLGTGDLSCVWAKSHEKITFAVNGKRYGKDAANRGKLAGKLRRGTVLNYQRLNASGNVNHLTEKPVPLLRELIEASSMFDDTILDCFAGSGSTLEAALREERKAIGIELSEKNCEVIVRRLEKL